jgi:imidazolonepropionase
MPASVVADFLIRNSREVVTCAGPAPRRGRAQADAPAVVRGVVAARGGTIVYVGPEADWRRVGSLTTDAVTVDAAGGDVVPGFVDAHTHAVFAGDRRAELRRRLAGATYAEIAAAGGGILETVRATRAASERELLSATRLRLDEMLRSGTTTCEVKSGYGLTTESELKLLRVVAQLADEHPMELSPTFLGAHDVPAEFHGRRSAYVDLIRGDMLPAVAASGLAEWCDVFCESGAFSPEDARAILTDAARAGLKGRIHADELGPSGGSRVAAELAVRSADHLIFVDAAGIRALAGAGTVATLAPAAAFYLKIGRFAPARTLIAKGVPVAIASDVNPGGGFSPSLPFAMTLACFGMDMTFEEALIGATLNAAYALDRHDRIGSLEPGKQMDAVILAGPAIDLVRIGADTIRFVVKKGRIIDRDARR